MQILNLYYPYRATNLKYDNYFNSPYCIEFGNSKTCKRIIEIKNFRQVDDTLYRGGKPFGTRIEELKNMGIDTIIDLTNEHDSNGDINQEGQIATSLGMNYINLPFMPFENPPEEYVNKFFETIEQARKDNKKVFVHCKRGQDRTGLFVAMYKLKYNLADLGTCIREMVDMKHNSSYDANHVSYLKKFYYNHQLDLNNQPSCNINRSIVEMSQLGK